MRTIDLNKIIEKRELDPNDVAQQLFPRNKYPMLALNRVLAGKAVLDANQISKLALISGLSIDQLYSGNGWKMRSRAGIYYLQNGEYKAELNTDTWVTKIFHKDSIFHESIVTSGATPVSEYIDKLNLIIKKNQSNE
jgi:hypothetical protein